MHIYSRWSMNSLIVLLRFIPSHLVDSLLVLISKVTYGDLTKYGIQRPKEGPILLKARDCKYPVIDLGTMKKIKSGEIQVSYIHIHSMLCMFATLFCVKKKRPMNLIFLRHKQVLPALKGIKHGGNEVVFEDGKCHQFDAIVFATGF
ncbi:putative indole-3-pyruvate monooxygenase [Helianthus anomalus]